MGEGAPIDKSGLPLPQLEHLVDICDRFESAWLAGETPRAEDFLGDTPEPERAALLAELRALEGEYREAGQRTISRRAPSSTPKVDSGSRPAPPADYEVLEEIGRGGMGVVYRARQVELDRAVALKMLLADGSHRPELLARFRTEAQAVARLSHPNVVQIYAIGDRDGRPFFSMELVEGGSLASRLAGGPLPLRQAAQLAETLARAVHVAHQRGIVHRDLKPGNVLLTHDGVPKITDFGLALVLADPDARATRSGMILGTPSYMAPEQADGRHREVGPATDIYALGATLYEMLTGQPPFASRSYLDTLNRVLVEDPIPPSRRRSKLPRDLETICLKCLEKEPSRRYASAEALADDLHAYLGGEPIRAQPAGAAERALRWTRRRPVAAVLAATASAATVGLLVGVWFYSALAVGAVAVLGLLVGGSYYHARLQLALAQLDERNRAAERHAERLHLLAEMSRRMMTVRNPERLLRLLVETSTRLANAELATIYLVDPARGELCSRLTLDVGVGEIRIPLGVGIAGTVAITGETVNLSDAYADPRFNPEIDRRTGYRTRNLLTFPMVSESGRILGVFQVINKRAGCFDADDVEVLASLAASTAVAIDHAESG